MKFSVAITMFLSALLVSVFGLSQKLGVDGYECVVVSVYDGDTLTCAHKKETHRVRLIGVFAPELRKPGGKDALIALLRLAPIGSKITLEFDGNLYSFNRVLAYIKNSDGVFVNLELVRIGAASTSKKYPFKYFAEFSAAQDEAKKAKLGIWKPKPPKK